MIFTSYLTNIQQYTKWFSGIPGFLPYELYLPQTLLVVSKNRTKRIQYQISLLITSLSLLLMTLRILTKSYSTFVTILGISWPAAASLCLICRWNWSCDPQFVSTLNKLIIFEKYLMKKSILNLNGS